MTVRNTWLFDPATDALDPVQGYVEVPISFRKPK